jgi:bifunctional DNA-binding transcriptional regulator/antitoxin component of YhaV-PrlF toxin-antitoxin module
MIILPTRWREAFGFSCGEHVDVISSNGMIIIKRPDYRTYEHKRYVSPKGGVTIPTKIRKQLGISQENDYCLYVDPEKEQFVVVTHDKGEH